MGGIGFHQVDLRDHRNDFATPLEYLTLGDAEVEAALANGNHANYFGNTPRVSQYIAWLEEAGFSVETEVNSVVSSEELARVRARLNPKYACLSGEELGVLGALFRIRRRPA